MFFFLPHWPNQVCAEESSGEERPSFDNLKKVLDNDFLKQKKLQKKNSENKRQNQRLSALKASYMFPEEDDFWPFFSEFWLVQNAQWLKWDRDTPSYGFDLHFKALLEKLGIFHQRVDLLFHQSPLLPHFALPAGPKRTILLLSIPFLRTFDFTKMEVSLMLLEDFLRVQSAMLRKELKTEGLQKFYGKNFYKKDQEFYPPLEGLSNKLTVFVKNKGFSFMLQKQLTDKMDALLKSYPELWNSYYQLLLKLKKISEDNVLYKNLSRLYPSPAFQLGWLSPPGKVL